MPWVATEPSDPRPTWGCEWPVVSACCELEEQEPDKAGWARQAAIEILWAATGRRYGLCPRTIRPCLERCLGPAEPNTWNMVGRPNPAAVWPSGIPWGVVGCGCDRGSCDCTSVQQVALWNRDVRRVVSVVVDGVTLGRSLWRRDGRWLIRLPGEPVVVDDWSDADVSPGSSVMLPNVSILGDVGLSGGVHVIAGTGLVDVLLNESLPDVSLTLVLDAGDSVTLQEGAVLVSGPATLNGDLLTATETDAIVVAWSSPQGAVGFTVPAETGEAVIAAVQWSDLSEPNPGWPTCQDRNVAPGEPGSWTVTYMHGTPVPVAGQLAAGEYACQLLLALTDSDECRLPERIRTRVVDGMTIGFVDPMTYLDKGKTGLERVDEWIGFSNPNRLQRRPRVLTADGPRRRRPGW